MSAMQTLFGGSTSTTSPEQLSMYTPEQQAMLKKLTDIASGGLGQPSPSMPSLYTPQTGQEDTYFSWVNSLGRQKGLQNVLSGTPGYEINPETTDKYFEESVRPGYMREFQETVLPTLRTSFSGPGYYGSARMGQEAKAGSDLAYKLASARAELGYKDEEARRESIDKAYERIRPATETMTDIYGTAGQYTRAMGQEQAADKITRFLRGEMVDGQYDPTASPNIQLAMALLGFSPYGYGSNTDSTTAGGVVPGLASLLSGGSKFYSAYKGK